MAIAFSLQLVFSARINRAANNLGIECAQIEQQTLNKWPQQLDWTFGRIVGYASMS
tara:strand:+ start:386 stop:553 length:168 start_codon:yes stop_codon:yes gene_type:complete